MNEVCDSSMDCTAVSLRGVSSPTPSCVYDRSQRVSHIRHIRHISTYVFDDRGHRFVKRSPGAGTEARKDDGGDGEYDPYDDEPFGVEEHNPVLA